MLLRAVRGETEKVTVREILDALDARSFGLAVLLFSLPSVVPMPPGVPTVVGIILLIVSIQMVIGREDLWLPGILSKRAFDRKSLVKAFDGAGAEAGSDRARDEAAPAVHDGAGGRRSSSASSCWSWRWC